MYYHTQEDRGKDLEKPLKCIKNNAWLGHAYYFWEDKEDAHHWGEKSKKNKYVIYEMTLGKESEILDTVFNRKHYHFWVRAIEKASKNIAKKIFKKPTLEELNDYLKNKGFYEDVDGILFQDISKNPNHYLVEGMQYKKRIQLALYKVEKIKKFCKSI